jgi:DNA-binding CsgD family transcriptional regulator
MAGKSRKELTDRQREVLRLRYQDPDKLMTVTDIAKQLGLSPDKVKYALRRGIKRAGGRPPQPGDPALHSHEAKQPEAFADVLMGVTHAEAGQISLSELARQLGLPPSTVIAINKRLDRRYFDLKDKIGKIQIKDLAEMSRFNAYRVMASISDADIEAAPLRDKAVTAGILMDKMLLLEGRPTEIVTVEERHHIADLLPALLKEAERRGFISAVVEGEYRVVRDTGPENPGFIPTAPRRDLTPPK